MEEYLRRDDVVRAIRQESNNLRAMNDSSQFGNKRMGTPWDVASDAFGRLANVLENMPTGWGYKN